MSTANLFSVKLCSKTMKRCRSIEFIRLLDLIRWLIYLSVAFTRFIRFRFDKRNRRIVEWFQGFAEPKHLISTRIIALLISIFASLKTLFISKIGCACSLSNGWNATEGKSIKLFCLYWRLKYDIALFGFDEDRSIKFVDNIQILEVVVFSLSWRIICLTPIS